MRNTLKKLTAALLALAMCLTFAGCYDENKTWAAKKGESTMPIGGYIYYLYTSYNEAASKVDSNTDVLKGTIDGKEAKTWIRDQALNRLKAFYYISDKFDELGLTLTDEDKADMDSVTSGLWSYYQTTMEELGVSRDSLNLVHSVYSMKYQKVFEAMYGEGGELAIPENELKTYYTDNYYSYEYFYAPLSKTNEDGTNTDLSDDEKAELKSTFEKYAEQINGGKTTVNEAANEYAVESATDSTYNSPMPAISTNINSTMLNALKTLEDNKATFVETSTSYYVLRRLPVADKFEELLSSDLDKLNLLSSMKGEDFDEYVLEKAAEVQGVEVNEKALNSVNLSTLVNDNNKKGTASSSAETSSSAASSAPESSESSASSGTESSEA